MRGPAIEGGPASTWLNRHSLTCARPGFLERGSPANGIRFGKAGGAVSTAS